MKHIPGLDGLRAVAVLVVVLFHAEVAGASGGFLGVSLFFTLSGFLITSLLLDEFERTETVSLRRFYTRRVRRLLPAAYLCLLLVALWGGWWTAQQQRELPGDLLASVANVANWRFAFSGTSYAELLNGGAPSPVAHFWSLAIEEQVYLILPVVLLLAMRRGRRTLATVVGGLLVASVAATLLTTDRDLIYNGTHTRAAEVLIGSVLALVMARRRLPDGGWRPVRGINQPTAVLMAGGFAVLVVAGSVEQGWIYRGGLPIVGVLSAALIAAVVTGRLGVLEARPLVAIGAVSYGIYLFHWPVFLFLDGPRTGLDGPALFVLRCLVTAGLTMLSYRLVEQPVRTGRVAARSPGLLGVVGVGAVAVVAAALVVVPQPMVSRTEQILALGTDDVVEFEPPVTASRLAAPRAAPAVTTTTVPPPDVRVLVVGSDGAAVPALRAIDGIEVFDGVRPGCLLMPADIEGCVPLPEHVAALRAAHDPDVVVVTAGAGEAELAVVQNDAATDGSALEALALLHQGAIDALLRVVDESAGAGASVMLSSNPGKISAFYPRLARVAVIRPDVGNVIAGSDDLVARVGALAEVDATTSVADDEPLRLLVIGDSTSLSMAQAFNDGSDGRFTVLWAGANGCAFVQVDAVRSMRNWPWRQLDCESYDTKLPPIVESFEPDAVFLMTGPLEQTEQQYPGTEGGHIAGDPVFMGARDRAMESLLRIVGPRVPVIVADFPQVAVGEYAAEEMLDPARLDALNAQVAGWDDHWIQVQRFDYRAPLEAAEAALGTLRTDGVHPDARQIEDLTRTTLAPQLLDQIASMREELSPVPTPATFAGPAD